MDQGKVFCRCVEGHCFLEKDAEWAKQNHAQALHPNGISLDRTLLGILDAKRLREKSDWMHSLEVRGICQICCRQEALHEACKDRA